MKSFVLFGASCLCLVVAFVVRQHMTTQAEIARLGAQLDAQRSAKPERLPTPMIVTTVVRPEPGRPAMEAPAEAQPEIADEPGDPSTPESAAGPEADQARADEELVRRTSELDSQVYDRDWAPVARAEVERGFGELKGSSLRKVECRAQLCRAEVDHADAERRADFVRSLQVPDRFWKGELEILAQPDANGVQSTSVVFLGRPGWHFDS